MRFKNGISPLRGWSIIIGYLAALYSIVHWAPEMLPVAVLCLPVAWFLASDHTPRKPLWKMFRKDRA